MSSPNKAAQHPDDQKMSKTPMISSDQQQHCYCALYQLQTGESHLFSIGSTAADIKTEIPSSSIADADKNSTKQQQDTTNLHLNDKQQVLNHQQYCSSFTNADPDVNVLNTLYKAMSSKKSHSISHGSTTMIHSNQIETIFHDN